MEKIAEFRRRYAMLNGACLMAAVILMVVSVTNPRASLAVALIAFPALGFGVWLTRCPHCSHRLVSNGATEVEWRRSGRWWVEPSKCKHCGNEL